MKEFLVAIIALSLGLMLFATPPPSGVHAARTDEPLKTAWVNPDGARGAAKESPRGALAQTIAMWMNPAGESGPAGTQIHNRRTALIPAKAGQGYTFPSCSIRPAQSQVRVSGT